MKTNLLSSMTDNVRQDVFLCHGKWPSSKVHREDKANLGK